MVTVVVVLASGDPSDGSTTALDHALRTALGDRAEVVIRFDEPRSAASSENLIAHVEWADHEKRAVLHTTDGARTSEREIRFDASDEAVERGRTVGFALASMVPDAPAVARPPPTPPPVVIAPVVVPKERPATSIVPKPKRFSVELLGQGATGTAGGLGGAIGARAVIGYGISARAAFGLRLGDVPSAQATSRMLTPAVGVGWATSLNDALRVGVRVDALLIHQHIAHFSADDPEPDGRSRLVPGADARVEGTFRIAESTSVMLALGPEIAFGTTEIYVRGAETDRTPITRLSGEIGVTVAF